MAAATAATTAAAAAAWDSRISGQPCRQQQHWHCHRRRALVCRASPQPQQPQPIRCTCSTCGSASQWWCCTCGCTCGQRAGIRTGGSQGAAGCRKEWPDSSARPPPSGRFYGLAHCSRCRGSHRCQHLPHRCHHRGEQHPQQQHPHAGHSHQRAPYCCHRRGRWSGGDKRVAGGAPILCPQPSGVQQQPGRLPGSSSQQPASCRRWWPGRAGTARTKPPRLAAGTQQQRPPQRHQQPGGSTSCRAAGSPA